MHQARVPKVTGRFVSTAHLSKSLAARIVLVLAIGVLASAPLVANAAQPTVGLGTAAPFAILAGTPGITDAGNASVIRGNVGLSPATGAGIGLNCSQVTGTIYSVDAAGPLPCRVTDPALLTTAKNDLVTAYNDAAGRTPVTSVPTELGGTTKTPGVYGSNSSTFQITAGSGPLTLNAQGDPSAVFIFEMDSDGTGLTAGPGSQVRLTGGAQRGNLQIRQWIRNGGSMDEKRYEELIQKRESSGLTALEADELGRLMAEKDSRQYGGAQARATAEAAEDETSEEARREDASTSSEIIEAEREGEAEKR